RVTLGPLLAQRGPGQSPLRVQLGGWRGVGAAATTAYVRRGAVAMVDFVTSGTPGVLRPAQPTDTHPVPVLADPQTAASAGPGGRMAVTVDGLPVVVRVVGILRRFPTLPPGAVGFLVADQPTLAAALDAQLPGQGRADELWITAAHPSRLRAVGGARRVGRWRVGGARTRGLAGDAGTDRKPASEPTGRTRPYPRARERRGGVVR